MNNIKERGAASLLIDLTDGVISIKHGTDNATLLQWTANEGDWNKLWEAIEVLKSAAAKHGEWVCPENDNQTVLPDEQGNCSLCSATLEAGWPEQKGND